MSAPATPDTRKLVIATLAAAGVAGLVLVLAILPAEYGIDPTGLGAAVGFAKLHDDPTTPPVTPQGENGPVSLYEMKATWRLVELPLAETQGHVSRADSEERVMIPLHIANLTSVTATLTWNDTDLIEGQLTQGDTLEISIWGPGGLRSQLAQAKNVPGQLGNASATLTLRSAPFPQENATGLTFGTREDVSGVGNWTFVVRLYTAGGLEGSDTRDPGQNWSLRVTGEAYELDVAKQTERLGDRVQLTLAPRQGLEYKFAMQPNATLTYRWAASGVVHSELHSDRFEDEEDVVTTKVADSDHDAGTYTANRYGRHGWYFRNDGNAPVTLTLETTGDYDILGVPR